MHFPIICYCITCAHGMGEIKAEGPVCAGDSGTHRMISIREARTVALEGDRSDEHFRQKAFKKFGDDINVKSLTEGQVADLLEDEKPQWRASDKSMLSALPGAQKHAQKQLEKQLDARTQQWLHQVEIPHNAHSSDFENLLFDVNELIANELQKEFGFAYAIKSRFAESCSKADGNAYQRMMAALRGGPDAKIVEFATDKARSEFLLGQSNEDLLFFRDNRRAIGVAVKSFEKDLAALEAKLANAKTAEEAFYIQRDIDELKELFALEMQTLRANWIAEKMQKVADRLDAKIHALVLKMIQEIKDRQPDPDDDPENDPPKPKGGNKGNRGNRSPRDSKRAESAARDAADRSILNKLLSNPSSSGNAGLASGLSPSRSLASCAPGSADHAAASARAGAANRLAAAGNSALADAVCPDRANAGSTLQGQNASGAGGSSGGASGAGSSNSSGDNSPVGKAAKALSDAASKSSEASAAQGKAAGKMGKAAKGLGAAAAALADAAKAMKAGSGSGGGSGGGGSSSTPNAGGNNSSTSGSGSASGSNPSSSASAPKLSSTSPSNSAGSNGGSGSSGSSGGGGSTGGSSGGRAGSSGSRNSSSGSGSGAGGGDSSGAGGMEFPSGFILLALLVGAYVLSNAKEEIAAATLGEAIGADPEALNLVQSVEA